MKRFTSAISFAGFWLFLLFFKFGGALHYALNSPMGERFLPLWAVGLLMGIASAIQMVLDIPAGKILDRFGYRRMLAIGTVLFLASLVLLFFASNAIMFILSILLSSLGWLFFGPGRNAYALSQASKKQAGKFMALRDIFGSIGVVLSCIVLPFVVNKSLSIISVFIFALLTISLISIMFSPKDRKKLRHDDHIHEKTHHQRTQLFNNFAKTLKVLNPASSLLVLLNFAGAVFYGVVWFVVPLVIANNIANGQILGVGLAMFDFAIIVVGTFLYRIVDKGNKKLMILLGLFIFSIAGMIIGFNYGLLFLLFAFLATAGDEVASLPLWAWLHQLDKNHNEDGLISGMLNLWKISVGLLGRF